MKGDGEFSGTWTTCGHRKKRLQSLKILTVESSHSSAGGRREKERGGKNVYAGIIAGNNIEKKACPV